MMHLTEAAIARLRTQHQTLSFLLKGVNESIFIKRPLSNKWSIQENTGHLGRYQEIFMERIHSILNEDTPHFGRYQAEEDPLANTWMKLPAHTLLSRIKQKREEIIPMVIHLAPEALAREGVHPKLGSMPIPWWIEFFLLHEAHHLYTILWIIRETENH